MFEDAERQREAGETPPPSTSPIHMHEHNNNNNVSFTSPIRILFSEIIFSVKVRFDVGVLWRVANENNLFELSRSHDQDGHHANVWQKPLKNSSPVL